MPDTLPTLDPTTLAALRAGDESALERLFRERRDALFATAKTALDEPVRAARATERTMVDLWNARAGLGTPEAVELFLESALRDEIVRQRGRAASQHRLEHLQGAKPQKPQQPQTAPSADESWEHIRAALHRRDDVQGVEAMREEARHTAVAHMAEVGKKKTNYTAIFGLVGLAVVLGGGFYFFSRGTADEAAVSKALESPQARTVASKSGQRGNFKLDDGSSVAIGSGSEVTIPPGFVSRYRTVRLAGTASFTVAAGSDLPFKVRAGNATITATGTLFDVSAFPEDGKVSVRVREGSVTVEARGGMRTVERGAAIVVRGGDMLDATQADVDNAFSWTDGQLRIVDLPLKDVVPLMQRWYGLVLTPASQAMLERRVTMSAGLDSMRAAIRELQANANVMIDYDGKKNPMRDLGGT